MLRCRVDKSVVKQRNIRTKKAPVQPKLLFCIAEESKLLLAVVEMFLVTVHELVHTSSGIDQLHFSGKERV